MRIITVQRWKRFVRRQMAQTNKSELELIGEHQHGGALIHANRLMRLGIRRSKALAAFGLVAVNM